jgi:hypothetical protein
MQTRSPSRNQVNLIIRVAGLNSLCCSFAFVSGWWPRAEEFIKKRRVEQTTTKQVETRVKRQVLVDQDGQVVEDSGPQVTTNTTREDTETKEENHTEVRSLRSDVDACIMSMLMTHLCGQ